jgi:hypothetical protein
MEAKMKKRFLLALSISLIALLIFVGTVSAAPAKKVDVCHLDKDTGIYHLINISSNALAAHMAHGDGVPDGINFTPDCTPIPVLDVTGTWTGYDNIVGDPTQYPFTMVLVQAADGSVTGTIDFVGYSQRTITGNVSVDTLYILIVDSGISYSSPFTGLVSGGNSYYGTGTDSLFRPLEIHATMP